MISLEARHQFVNRIAHIELAFGLDLVVEVLLNIPNQAVQSTPFCIVQRQLVYLVEEAGEVSVYLVFAHGSPNWIEGG